MNQAPSLTGSPAADPMKRVNGTYVVTKADLLQGYTDPDGDPLSISGVDATTASIYDRGDGTYSVTPTTYPWYYREGTFFYTVTDGVNETQASFSFDFNAINHAPILSGSPAALPPSREDEGFIITTAELLQGYTDPDGDTLELYDADFNYPIDYVPIRAQHAGVYDNRNGTYSVLPEKNYNGPITLSYGIIDGSLDYEDKRNDTKLTEATLTVNIKPVNDTPRVIKETLPAIAEDSGPIKILSSTLLANDFSPQADEKSETLTLTSIGRAVGGTAALDSDGNIVFTPAENFYGTAYFDYIVTDNGTTDGRPDPQSASNYAYIPVTAVGGDAPVASDDKAAVLQRQTVSGNVIADGTKDFDPDGDRLALTQIGFGGVTKTVTASGTGITGAHGTLAIKRDGTYSYIAHVEGGVAVGDKAFDSFKYSISDGGGVDTATFTFRVVGADTGDSGSNQFLLTGSGTTARGFAGNDTYVIDSAADDVIESAGLANGFDTIFSSVKVTRLADNIEKLVLTGRFNLEGEGNDLGNVIVGNKGGNTLDGGLGRDFLTGGAGRDTFFFSTKPSSSNVDHVRDFRAVDDTIKLENSGKGLFTKLPKGDLDEDAFALVKSGKDVVADEARILYDKGHGVLYYDPNGGSAAGRVEFAVLDNHAALTWKDFLIV